MGNLLKKEFREKDIQRIRNIVAKKYGKATTTQVGYTVEEKVHNEGDIWEENDKMWTIKDGIKQSYTKLDEAKRLFKTPLCCPKCDNRMKLPLDKKMYAIHGACLTCVQEMESELKLSGKYEEYVENYIKSNVLTFVGEAKDFIEDYAKSKHTIVNEEGDIEEWNGNVSNTAMLDQWKKELEELEETLKK